MHWPLILGLAAQTGVWLEALEDSATVRALWLGKEITFALCQVMLGGGLAQLVTSLVASTKLINTGPG